MTTQTAMLYGAPKLHRPEYTEADWSERDNFDNLDEAIGYARYLARKHPRTPYRIVDRDYRWVVEFVTEAKLIR